MMNNVFEQLEELYSRWSEQDKGPNQIYQMQVGLNNQKMTVDKGLIDETIKHLIKMKAKHI